MGAFISIQWRLGGVCFVSCRLNFFQEGREGIDDKSWMCLARWMKVRFNTQMEMNIARSKPCAAPFGEIRWFLNFSEIQNADIKIPGSFFFTCGHSDLDMVDGEDFHGSTG